MLSLHESVIHALKLAPRGGYLRLCCVCLRVFWQQVDTLVYESAACGFMAACVFVAACVFSAAFVFLVYSWHVYKCNVVFFMRGMMQHDSALSEHVTRLQGIAAAKNRIVLCMQHGLLAGAGEQQGRICQFRLAL